MNATVSAEHLSLNDVLITDYGAAGVAVRACTIAREGASPIDLRVPRTWVPRIVGAHFIF
jgi:hypothetical protein